MCAMEEDYKPMQFLNGFVICVSGYTTDERTLLSGMVESCGGIYMEDMESKSVTYLISKGLVSEKAKHACKWGVPILSHQWLFDCLAERRLRSINGYLLNGKN
ncbi:BRCT domain-containing protein [Entamoeba marina]